MILFKNYILMYAYITLKYNNLYIYMSDQICYNNCNITEDVTDLISKAKKLKESGERYQEHGDINGALYSYSNCSSILYIIKTLFENMCDDTYEMNKHLFFEKDLFLSKLENNYQDILNRVDQLQTMLKKNLKNKDEDEISCKEISNVSLSGTDCIFFDDVIGLEPQKMEIEETFIKPIIYPSLYGQLSKGILLYGPPGTGKTLLVKSAVNTLATAYKQNMISVIFFSPTAADLKGKYVGESEKKIKELFICAHRKACECQANDKSNRIFLSVIFIDEIDNVGASRTNDNTGMMKQTVNALLQAMDGVESSKNVIVMGATNNPWELDSALLRRFTNHILVDLPKNNDIKKLIQKEIVEYLNRPDIDITKCVNQKKDNTISDNKCDSMCLEKQIDKDYWTNELSKYNRQYNVLISNNDNFLNKIAQSLEKKMNSNSDINQIMNESFSQMADNILHSQTFVDSQLISNDNKPIFISGISNKEAISNQLLKDDQNFPNSDNFISTLFDNRKYYLSLFGIDKYKTLLEKPYIQIENDIYINIFFCPDRHPILYNTYKDVHSVYLEKECYKSMIKLKQKNYNINEISKEDTKKLEQCRILINKEINIVAIPTEVNFNVLIKDYHTEFILLYILNYNNHIIKQKTTIEIGFNELLLYDESNRNYGNISIPDISQYLSFDYESYYKTNFDITKINNVKEIRYQYENIVEDEIIIKLEEFIDLKQYNNANVLIIVHFLKKDKGSLWIQLIHNVLNAYNDINPVYSYDIFDTILRTQIRDTSLIISIQQLYNIKGISNVSKTDKTGELLIIIILKKLIDKYREEQSKIKTLKIFYENQSSLLDLFKIDDNIKLTNIEKLAHNITNHINYVKSKKIQNNIKKKTNIYIECEIDLYNTQFSKMSYEYNTGIVQIVGKGLKTALEMLKKLIVVVFDFLKSIFFTIPDLPANTEDNYLDTLSESFYETLTSIFQNDIVYLLLSNSKKYFYKNNNDFIQVDISQNQLKNNSFSCLFGSLFLMLLNPDSQLLKNEFFNKFLNNTVISFIGSIINATYVGAKGLIEMVLNLYSQSFSEGFFPFIESIVRTLMETIKGLLVIFVGTINSNFAIVGLILSLFGSWWISDRLKLPNISTIYFANRLKDKNLYISESTYIKVFGANNNESNFDKLFYDEIHPGFVDQDSKKTSFILNAINTPFQNIHYFINHIRFAFLKDTKLLQKDLYYMSQKTNTSNYNEQFKIDNKSLIWNSIPIYYHNSNVILKNYNINLNIIKINADNKVSIVNKKDYENLIKYKEKPQDVIKIYNDK